MNKTRINSTQPWGLIRRNGNRLLCADGVIRSAELASTADTFFSIPASIRLNGKRVSGYASCDEAEGERIWTFHPHTRHGKKELEWSECFSPCRQSTLKKAIR